MTKQRIEIDGRMGEGGGQILRTSLTLAMLYGYPLSIRHIRNKRPKPGLLRQHLACVRAAQAVCQARVEGAELRSETLVFEPGAIQNGDFEFEIGSAGSTTLVFQTVLLPLLAAPGPSTVRFVGGTHNPWAPPLTFLESSFLPLLRQMGARVTIESGRWGFHPAGGGHWCAHIEPGPLHPFHLLERPAITGSAVTAYNSHIRRSVAEREIGRYRELTPIADTRYAIEHPDAVSAGNLLSHTLAFGDFQANFSELGQNRVMAETVAERLARNVQRYLAQPGVLCEHLADQIMLPMLVAEGGGFSTGPLSSHAETNRLLIERITGQSISVRTEADQVQLSLP